MEQLLEELEPEFGGGRIFRPYRDVRFSNDKSPYKTNIAAMVGDMGYVSFEATGLGVTAASSTWHRTSSTATGRRSQGYAKDHPRIDLLRWKGVAAYRQWAPAAWLATAKQRSGSSKPCERQARFGGRRTWKTNASLGATLPTARRRSANATSHPPHDACHASCAGRLGIAISGSRPIRRRPYHRFEGTVVAGCEDGTDLRERR